MSDFQTSYHRLLSLGNLVTKPYTDSKKELRASLKRMRAFLDYLGAPDEKLQIVHVAGTSGKGSVVSMIRHILHTDGQTVGSYTSPHTTSYLQRFSLGERLVDPIELAQAIDDVIDRYSKFLQKESTPLSFFELSTAIALYTFAKQGVKWCILETGCGGRFDATNVISTPRAAVITNIDKDHTEILGSSLTDIARAKAGIIKKNGTIFCGEMRPAIRKIFMKEAIKHSAALFFVHPPHTPLLPETFGAHQQHNAALAMAVGEELGLSLDAMNEALKSVKLMPCRFETMQTSPRVILDGAHSPAKIKALVRQLEHIKQPIHVIFGSTATKDAKQMVEHIAKSAQSVTMTRFTTSFRKAANPFNLLKLVGKRKRAGAYLSPFEALASVLEKAKNDEIILVTGSLYLCGELRTHWISEVDILKNRSSFT